MEDKGIWWLTTSISYTQTEHNREINKRQYPLKKGELGITKNNKDIITYLSCDRDLSKRNLRMILIVEK